MKFLLRLLLGGALFIQPLLAQFGTDNFANSSNWTVGTPTGGATFTFNNRLEYLVSTPTTNDAVTATWQPGYAPYASDWSVVVDLHLLSMTLTSPSKSVYLNLMVSDKDTPGNYMKVYQFRTWGGSAMEGFDSELNGSGNLTGYAGYLSSTATDSSLLISFNSTTKVLSSFVGIAPTYTWTPLESVDIGSGTYLWGSNGFTIQLAASSASMGGTLAFSSGDAHFSNFAVSSTAIPEPATYAAAFGLIGLIAAGLRRRFGQQ